MDYEKAFKIIINKNIELYRLNYAIMINDLCFYNHAYKNVKLHLTEEDFDFLKEAICHIK